ncbi:MAG: type II toxin-antitoxin system VapC family toxin [Bacteroidetes bacterium]|nr:type II toxin-antitoxin system VapC family toxin [Bacteroidota bacterium]
MEIIVDANAFLAVILNEPEKQKIIEITKGMELVSPEVLPYEIGNALTAMFKRKRLTKEQIYTCFDIFNTIPVRLLAVDIAKSLKMACDFNCYAYDAYYLELAHRLKIPLLTLDKQMKNNAEVLTLRIMEI